MPNFIDLGPEMFADKELTVISYKGVNYYRACGEHVQDLLGGSGASSCVKRIDHPHKDHEDYYGVTREK